MSVRLFLLIFDSSGVVYFLIPIFYKYITPSGWKTYKIACKYFLHAETTQFYTARK
jgi:hypothetical protein